MGHDLDPRALDTPDRETADPRTTGERDPREAFAAGLDLPRGAARERVYVHDEAYELRGSEVRALTTIGAFRVVPARDLRDDDGRTGDLRHGDLEHLRAAGLIRRVTPMDGTTRGTLVALTDRGREVLEHHRTSDPGAAQRFYAGPAKVRELSHDALLYRAYMRSADRLAAQGIRVQRVVLDDELKREYQAFLQDGNRDRSDSDGRPTRTRDEAHAWADAHDLPWLDDHVQFPDLRIEYEWPDGRRDVEDVEVMTAHYRGAHAAAKGRSGFTCYGSGGSRVGGRSGQGGRGRPFDPDRAKDILR